MKYIVTIHILLILGYSSYGQMKWEIVSKEGNEKVIKNTVFWEYKDKVILFSKEKFEFSKESGLRDLIISTSEKSDKVPGFRREGMQWATDDGVWLFGGISDENHTLLNDMWFYHVDKGDWQEISVSGETPSPRRGSGCWTDEKNNLWMFGGYQDTSKDGVSMNLNNELWSFSISDRKWIRWESKNLPAPRANMAIWKIGTAQILLYGGFGLNKEHTIARGLSDLWQFDLSSGAWSELDKEKSPLSRSLGVAGSKVHPGYRINPAFWTDGQGYCWLSFGQSIISLQKISIEPFLWRLDPKNLSWSFVPVSSDPYIMTADHIMPGRDGSITLYFPTYVNHEKELIHQSQILKLNPDSK